MFFLLILGLFALVMAASSFIKVYRFKDSDEQGTAGARADSDLRKLRIQAYVYLFFGLVCAAAFLIFRSMAANI